MENIFTPGPWKIEKLGRGAYGAEFILKGNTKEKVFGENGTIAVLKMRENFSCDWQFPKDKDGEMIPNEGYNIAELDAEANARLISFAPEMYDMLKRWSFQDGNIKELIERIEKKEEIKISELENYEIY